MWRLDKLPGITAPHAAAAPRARLRFDRITQPWLRELGKRWLRLRLTSGLSITTAQQPGGAGLLQPLPRAVAASIGSPTIDRPLLERHLAWSPPSPADGA